MNSMLIIASLIAVAVATPMHRGLVTPGAGIAPIITEPTLPVAVGPTPIIGTPEPIIDGPVVPVIVGPTPIVDESLPISIGAAVIDFEPVQDVPAVPQTPAITTSPLVQIIVNINSNGEVVAAPVASPVPTPVVSEVVAPGPVNIVDGPVSPIAVVAPEVGPVNIVDSVDVQVPEVAPIGVGTPVLPEFINPVAVGTPILPAPVAVLPDMLN